MAKNANKESLEIKEIHIPFQTAKMKYGVAVAAIVDDLNSSSAQAKGKQPGDSGFRWFITYNQPADPEIRDEKAFAEYLKQNTTAMLVCRGYRWKGAAVLKGDLPEQIVARYEERARLICSGNANLTVPEIPAKNGLSTDLDVIISLLESLRVQYNVKSGFLQIAELALQNLKNNNG